MPKHFSHFTDTLKFTKSFSLCCVDAHNKNQWRLSIAAQLAKFGRQK